MTYLGVENLPNAVIDSIRPSTCLITVMLANNETGIIFSVAHIARWVLRSFFSTKKVFLPKQGITTPPQREVCLLALSVSFSYSGSSTLLFGRQGPRCYPQFILPLVKFKSQLFTRFPHPGFPISIISPKEPDYPDSFVTPGWIHPHRLSPPSKLSPLLRSRAKCTVS